MKQIKRAISMLLVLVMLLGMMPAMQITASAASLPLTDDEITAKIDDYWSIVSSYMAEKGKSKIFWNADYMYSDLDKFKSEIANKDYVSCTTFSPCPGERTAHTSGTGCLSNGFKGISLDPEKSWGYTQCQGFADYMIYVLFQTTAPSDFTKISDLSSISNYEPHPGDLFRWDGHSAIIHKIIGNTIYFIDCNWAGGLASNNCIIGKGTRTYKNASKNNVILTVDSLEFIFDGSTTKEYIMVPNSSLRADCKYTSHNAGNKIDGGESQYKTVEDANGFCNAVCKGCGAEFSYKLYYTENGKYEATSAAQKKKSPYEVGNTGEYLVKGEEYTVVAATRNAYGNKWYLLSDGMWMHENHLTLLEAITLSAPTGLTATRVSSSSARISWNSVANAKEYIVTLISSANSTERPDSDYSNNKATSYVSTNLLNIDWYEFRVCAVTTEGTTPQATVRYTPSSGSTHTHSYTTIEYEALHPHKQYGKCSCNEATQYTGKTMDSYSSTITKAATCTETGVLTKTCTLSYCGVTTTETIPATGHNYSSVVTAPSCTAKGYTTYTCSACGNSYTGNETAALGHNYESVVTEPTATEQGYTTHTCSRCKDSYVDSYTDPLEGGFTEWSTEQPPEGAVNVQSKTVYRYRSKQYQTTTNATLPAPWVQVGSDSVSYGSWSGWTTTPAYASATLEVQTQTIPATTKTQYNYSKYTQYSNGGGYSGPWENTWNNIYCGYYQEYGWIDSQLEWDRTEKGYWNKHTGTHVDVAFYKSPSRGTWYNQITRVVEATPAYTQYNSRSITTTRQYWQWGAWSADENPLNWTATTPETYGSYDEYESATLYRYTVEPEHDYVAVITEPTCTDGGYTTYTCSVCGESYVADEVAALDHDFVDGFCTECGEADPDAEVPTPEEPDTDLTDENMVFMRRSLSLQDYIGIQCIMQKNLASDYDSVYALIEYDDGSTEYAEPIVYATDYYVFEVPMLSTQMCEEVTMTLCGEKDGKVYTGESSTASVRTMGMTILNGTNEISKKIVANMLNYGAAVQTAFDINADDLANALMTGEHQSYATSDIPEMEATNTTTGSGTMNPMSVAISMQDKVELQFVFTQKDMSAYEAYVTVNGKTEIIDGEDFDVYSGSYGLLRIPMKAADLREVYEVAFYEKSTGEQVSKTYTRSVQALACTLLGGPYNDVVIEMMKYGDAVAELG